MKFCPVKFDRSSKYLLLSIAIAILGGSGISHAQERMSEILKDRSIDWRKPTERAQAVQRMKALENSELNKARVLARQRGKALIEKLPGLGKRELIGIDEYGELLYVETKNDDAAISTGVDILHAAPYSLDGSGLKVGVWDGDSALVTHQEFNEGATSRINNVDNQPSDAHATHVAGTIAAFGVQARAKGMAFQAVIDSYDWYNDRSEMAAAAAYDVGQFDTNVYLSNHSYGFIYGWRNSGGWIWTGTGTDQNAYDPDFGQYSGTAANLDSIAYDAPYYLAFWAAGNENNDGPGNGNTVTIDGASVTYNSAIHPQNDGSYRNGFETIGDHGVAKNLVTVGAANDAVSNGQRDPSRATKVGFSSTGPTDDGRIKPDLMGNGSGLYSPVDSSDTSYSNYSGTSMASPNVCGSAALLVDLYRELFGNNAAMRSSTLKALLIHTATDIGNQGPDYTHGWGLVNVVEAADLLQRQAVFPDLETVIEDQVATTQSSQTYTFSWDGSSPIRATLCWTDPAGSSESSHDDRSPDLVNDLNLKLIAPDGTEYFPFVMPFVGTWTVESMSLPATTGVNNVDNVEQVLVESPGQAGAWEVEVTYSGSLTNNQQDFGLIISGSDTAGALAFSPVNYVVNEADGTVSVSVERIGGTVGAVSVDYLTQDGTATAGSDYATTSGTLNWAAGEGGARTIDIPITNDSVSETYEESFTVLLSDATGTSVSGFSSATVTIIDDEPLMAVVAPNGSEDLPVNSAFTINWASSLGGDVRIELLKGGTLYTTIANTTANDGSFAWNVPAFAPDGGDYTIRITSLAGGSESDVSNSNFSINNLTSAVIYSATMDTDPGWTLEGQWEYGMPKGNDGDPSRGNTGDNVIGYNLNGDYTNNLPATHATTGTIDCSGYSEVELSFYRWLGMESSTWDDAAIQVSNDGSSWITVWQHSGGSFTDSTWREYTYDISAVADHQPTVYIRWAMGATDGSVTYCGWNIDDVEVSGMGSVPNPGGEVAFSSPTFSVTENGGSATITVERSGGTVGEVSIDYATSNGTAQSGSDYTAASGTLTWADGDGSSKTFTVPITDDSSHEEFLETIILTLTNTDGAKIGTPNLATLEIQDDDNNAPAVEAGSDKAVILSDLVPWTPADITTALWLDADDADTLTVDGNTVSEWRDKSGNLRHATQGTSSFQPTATTAGLNGKNTLSFDGSSDYLNVDLDFMAGGSHSAFIVVADVTNYSNIYGAANGGNGSNSLHVGFRDSNSYRMNYWGHDWYGNVSSNFAPAGSILNYVWQVGSPKQIFANGNSEGSGHNANPPGTMSGGGRLGKVVTHPHFGGKIAEVIICSGTVSTAERKNIEGYLAHKWGLTARLPANHPYKVAPPGGTGKMAVVSLNDATASDDDGDSFTTQWTRLTGPAPVTFADDSLLNTTATFTTEGVYTLQLTGDDGREQSSDEVVITVNKDVLTLKIDELAVEENVGSVNASVSRLTTAGDLTVNMSSDDTSEATVPAAVTIPDGSSSIPITITIIDDTIADGLQTVTFTASAEGFDDTTATLDVINDDEASYASWISEFEVGGETGINNDYDNDGNSNGVENYFGTDPSTPTPGLKAEQVTMASEIKFTFSHPLNENYASDIAATYYWSTDLVDYHADGTANNDGVTVTFSVADPVGDTVTVTATVSGSVDKLFVDVRVSPMTP